METVVVFVLSILEVVALFVFMFTIFRFKIRYYFNEIIFISAAVSLVSYYLRFFEKMFSIVPIILLVLIVVSLWIVFKISPFYSAIMGISSYIGYSVVQAILLWVMQSTGILTLEQLKENGLHTGQLLQIVSIALTILLALLLTKLRLWFTFIPVSNSIRIKVNMNNVITLIAVCISVIVIGSIFKLSNMTAILIGLCSVAILIFYILFKRESA